MDTSEAHPKNSDIHRYSHAGCYSIGEWQPVLFCCFILSAASNNGTESLMTAQAEAGNKPR